MASAAHSAQLTVAGPLRMSAGTMPPTARASATAVRRGVCTAAT